MAAEENKWHYGDSEEQSSTPRPPPKKRFIASSSPSPAQSIDGDAGGDDSGQEDSADASKPLEAFRRDAIMRQWKEYRRSERRWKRRLVEVNDQHQKSEATFEIWNCQFQNLRSALRDLITDEAKDAFRDCMPKDRDVSYSTLVDADWASEHVPTVSAVMKSIPVVSCEIADFVKARDAKRERFSKVVKSCLEEMPQKENLLKSYEDALSTWVKGQGKLAEKSAEFIEANVKMLMLMEESWLLSRELESAQERLQKLETELATAENRIASISKPPERETESSTEPTSTTTDKNAMDIDPPPTQDSQDDTLVAIQQKLAQQLRDIEHVKEQRIELKQRLAQAEIDLITVPESHIYKTPTIRQIYQAREYQRDKSARLAEICQEMQRDLDDLHNNRRRFLADLDADQVKHIRELEAKLSTLDKSLIEIRGQRDSLQVTLEEQKACGDSGRASLQELRSISETQKEWTEALETEMRRLLLKNAAQSGNRGVYDLAMSMKDVSVMAFQNKLADIERSIEAAKQQCCGGANTELYKALSEELQLQAVANRLEKQASNFRENYGIDVNSKDEEAAFEALKIKLAEKKQLAADTREKLSSLEATESQLLNEIQSVSKVYSELKEQNMKKVQQLMAEENEVLQLLVERSKYSQAFTSLNKSKDAHAMVANALNKQIEKQLAYIKQLNIREKAFNNHVAALDRDLSTGKAVLEVYNRKSEELTEVLKELKEKLTLTKDQIAEMEKSIYEKIRLIEQGAHDRLRLEENSELLRRQIESATKIDRPSEQRIRKEIEQYRTLLNCSSCHTKLKSHVLMRCMHTFCKSCLDSRIETRQRRCPSCGEPFGASDVRQFYY